MEDLSDADEPWIHEVHREYHDKLPDGTVKLLLVLYLLSRPVEPEE